MAKSYKEINQDQRQYSSQLRQASTDTMTAFASLYKASLAEGALSRKHKELIALGIGIAARCDGCIGDHVAGALKAGASREELVETINVAIMMGGGPSVIYGSHALSAVDELSARSD
ncbi:alkylhydroperoxidase [Pokkaliibacter plantistimulans]|uniref:Alkylhydroperoxidase n=2 Tax=Pseudomonadota TaxID=1224 RepID=A0ABX5LZG9_9GAMM|nr:carboxymuconolactone decarboxylase family protein [Pokkaliibacter plantistimulans]PPC75809.1 carboxymuconolactone decarboxylase family protein [Pokkaliibacter plantistimulans]PXF31622.1 alkylhydroperoxidase [Pokkaliibacter plantistimulans]